MQFLHFRFRNGSWLMRNNFRKFRAKSEQTKSESTGTLS